MSLSRWARHCGKTKYNSNDGCDLSTIRIASWFVASLAIEALAIFIIRTAHRLLEGPHPALLASALSGRRRGPFISATCTRDRLCSHASHRARRAHPYNCGGSRVGLCGEATVVRTPLLRSDIFNRTSGSCATDESVTLPWQEKTWSH